MKCSVIIPVYNEEKNIGKLVRYLKNWLAAGDELIVCDAASTDNTLELAKDAGAMALLSPAKGRGAQMHYAASIASGEVLYFVHADVFPPTEFRTDISNAIQQGFDFGRYRMRFDTKKSWLRANEWFTRFDWFVCYGGDQTLFVTRALYQQSGGFRTDMRIMEDFEFTQRLKTMGKYKIFNRGALISDRKYDQNSWWQVQKANYKIVQMYKKGATQEDMVTAYKAMLKGQ